MDAAATYAFSRAMFGSKHRLIVAAGLAEMTGPNVTGTQVKRALKVDLGIDVNHNVVMIELRRLARGELVLISHGEEGAKEQPFEISDRDYLKWCRDLVMRLATAAA